MQLFVKLAPVAGCLWFLMSGTTLAEQPPSGPRRAPSEQGAAAPASHCGASSGSAGRGRCSARPAPARPHFAEVVAQIAAAQARAASDPFPTNRRHWGRRSHKPRRPAQLLQLKPLRTRRHPPPPLRSRRWRPRLWLRKSFPRPGLPRSGAGRANRAAHDARRALPPPPNELAPAPAAPPAGLADQPPADVQAEPRAASPAVPIWAQQYPTTDPGDFMDSGSRVEPAGVHIRGPLSDSGQGMAIATDLEDLPPDRVFPSPRPLLGRTCSRANVDLHRPP